MTQNPICAMQDQDIDKIAVASDDLANLATLLRWAGRAAEQTVVLPAGDGLLELGSAMVWAGAEIERRCASISESISDAVPYSLATAPRKTESAA
ncbi:hypothetical protein ACMAUO_11770 [Gluconacetobacter sp. Hr-1-5]|uniref:hypothetical protein n=1 Tax=Gluconacetobacter sp. Hr-1-5 TaxID=3395370 RepID=UPI003B529432